jgi:SAM-dependent methyltransferase
MPSGDAAMTEKPFSPPCERNREPILAVLRGHFADCRRVLEIGSGTGQHAVHFAAAMPWLAWQCSDVADNLPGIRMWLDEAGLANTPAPVELDVARGPWPAAGFDAVFSANTLHIMGWAQVEALFAGVGSLLQARGAILAVYGPFNYGGDYSSDSNRAFDGWLKARDPRSGIRDFEAVDALARGTGLRLLDDVAMPANNRCLVWRRDGAPSLHSPKR